MRAKTICNVPGCPNIAVKNGRCSNHQRVPWEGRTWASTGYGKNWLKIRRQVLLEEPSCRLCGRVAVTVDHIVPKARGGSDDRSNLQPLCDLCRKMKDKRDSADGRRLLGKK